MAIKQKHDIDLVFGISRNIPLSYIHRGVDDQFLNYLKRDKHIVLFGSSKQGKTSLVKRHLKQTEYITIHGGKTKNLNDIYSSILKEAGYEIEFQRENSFQKSNKTSLGFKVLPLLGLSNDSNLERNEKSIRKKLEFDVSSINDVIQALNSINFNKFLIIEDFHYFDEKVQEAFSYDLKVFNEKSNFIFIILGVWPSEDRLSRFNGDLAGRLYNINIDSWTNEDLLKVITLGEQLLNIKISEGAKDIIIESSFGSIAVLQELCNSYCKGNGINSTQEEFYILASNIHVTKILSKWIDNQNARFNSFLRKIINEHQTTLNYYQFIILCVIVIDSALLKEGIGIKTIHELIKEFQPDNNVNILNLENTLLNIKKHQFENNIIPCLFEYDDEKRILHVIDKFFFIWLANKNKFESMIDLGIDENLILKYMLIRY